MVHTIWIVCVIMKSRNFHTISSSLRLSQYTLSFYCVFYSWTKSYWTDWTLLDLLSIVKYICFFSSSFTLNICVISFSISKEGELKKEWAIESRIRELFTSLNRITYTQLICLKAFIQVFESNTNTHPQAKRRKYEEMFFYCVSNNKS